MTIDVKSYKEKVLNRKPAINLVPLIDILFTIMIFLVVTSNFSATDMSADDASSTDSGTGKPNVTDVSGDAEYYIISVVLCFVFLGVIGGSIGIGTILSAVFAGTVLKYIHKLNSYLTGKTIDFKQM